MFDYLGNKRWFNVTRTEVQFCADLYSEIRGREADFVEWLNRRNSATSTDINFDINLNWEVAIEVCYYRDLLFSFDRRVRDSDYSPKRTFDLCLFSPEDIVIIEAKAQQRFEKKQLGDLAEDKRTLVQGALCHCKKGNTNPRVIVLGLASSKYFENMKRYKRPISEVFDSCFSWKDLKSFSDCPSFLRADEIYGS